MPDQDWMSPQLYEGVDGLSVVVPVDGLPVDVSDLDHPDDVEVIEDAVQSDVFLDVSGDDVTRVSISFEDFKALVESSEDFSSVSDDDPVEVVPLAVDGDDISLYNFTPQQWQLNMAQNRPVGWHYLMTRTGTGNNNYTLILGRDIVYDNGLYTYHDADFYSVYTTGSSSGSIRYHYDIHDHWSGTVSSSSYMVYSDLYFDYLGGRSVSYSWLILAFIALLILFLIFFKGNKS